MSGPDSVVDTLAASPLCALPDGVLLLGVLLAFVVLWNLSAIFCHVGRVMRWLYQRAVS